MTFNKPATRCNESPMVLPAPSRNTMTQELETAELNLSKCIEIIEVLESHVLGMGQSNEEHPATVRPPLVGQVSNISEKSAMLAVRLENLAASIGCK